MRKIIATTVLTATFAAGLGMAGVSPAAAEERTCRGRLGAITVDNLKVPQGATCTLQGTKVKGTITVQRNATLVASNVRVVGNVQAENAARVDVIAGSRVNGSIQVVQGGSGRVANTVVGSDILFDDQDRRVVVTATKVGGNIQAFQNTGGVTISANRVDGNLQCKENAPRPTGGRNIVEGSKEDQCARL